MIYHQDSQLTIHKGDALAVLQTMAAESVQCCVTSPPYYGLRDYGVEGQIGMEEAPELFIVRLIDVFREVRRVLKDDGVLWVNIGDSYNNSDKWGGGQNTGKHTIAENGDVPSFAVRSRRAKMDGIKPKDLIGIPWMLAFALRADGWYLRSEIIWHKLNPMPESVTDRPTKAHEQIFLLSKSAKYFYDASAIAEPSIYPNDNRKARSTESQKRMPTETIAGIRPGSAVYETRNRRSVWSIASAPYSDAHFATFPPALIEPCILAGSRAGDTVLDPFGGSGTTAQVANKFGRRAMLIELNPEYCELAMRRNCQKGLFVGMEAE